METSRDRILTTHTGSLHRPPDLEEMFRKKLAGEAVDPLAFEARLRSAVGEIVRKQIDLGIDFIDDGEFSKVDFFSYAKYRMEGIEQRPVRKSEKESVSDITGIAGMGMQMLKMYYDSDESQEGVKAFKEKRKPDFRRYAR